MTVALYNGHYTFENVETGEHRTFLLKTQAADARFAPGHRVLSLLTGGDNENDYQPFAFVDDTRGVLVWTKKRTAAFLYFAELFSLVFRALNEQGRDVLETSLVVSTHGKQYRAMVSKTCRVCNRTLTTPESIREGIGPICGAR